MRKVDYILSRSVFKKVSGLKKTQKKKRRFLNRLVTIVCLGVFLFSCYQLLSIGLDYYQNQRVLADIQDVYTPSVEVWEDSSKRRSSFEPLLELNEDIVAWITVNDTKIDYPVLQAEDNDYYLFRNYLLEETRAGSIFMDYRNQVDANVEDKHTILYGHRMKDGTMFAALKNYLEQEFYESNQVFAYDTLYESYEVEVFAAYVTTTDFYYIETDFRDEEHYQEFLNEIQARSVIEPSIDIEAGDQIITLSTCDYQLDRHEGRLVVHGKLIPRS
ncbi:class B sortase [Alkalihalobacillus alcalophilus]|uniref:class B sortase n=1 Tax=Alkalihalobacillus alcalophilus TaxID=1445 RepID=UPI0006917C74|nr:class B sortase [Alkalihalobacillus alcalophilus]MED1560896.1 class B sortase [Alkalihalobacillus alcalophilus]